VRDAVFRSSDGTQIAGAMLAEMVDFARQVRAAVHGLASKYPANLVEQAAIAGALNADTLSDPARADAAAKAVATRLDSLSGELEQGWSGEATTRGLVFRRTLRGVSDEIVLDSALVASADARKLDRLAQELRASYSLAGTITRGDDTKPVRAPTELVEAISTWGQKGLTLQRYKGLGEMNPEQLWETTLDENARSLLQVRVNHGDTANDVFDKLMGDAVDPRREFIQANALAVANLDI
jgi:DNA gyrase subunit B